MRTKLITATAFSLLMAVGAANAQGATNTPAGDANSQPADTVTPTTPATPGVTDPMVTNSTSPGSDKSERDCGTADQSAISEPVTAPGEVAVNKCAD